MSSIEIRTSTSAVSSSAVMDGCMLLAGTGNTALASATAACLGVALGACVAERYPDGEISVELGESVRGYEVFLLQPTAPPVNDHLIQLVVLADACRRAAARRITAVIPYFGYARSDKREGRRRPVTASVVAHMLQEAGIDHVVAVDVHSPQLEGFFHIPIENLSAVSLLCAALRDAVPAGAVVVAPDLGAARRATEYSQRLGLPTAVCRKHRLSGADVAITQVIGDVRDRPCLIVDDMITTGGTVTECARALGEAGARPAPIVAATHGVFAPGAHARLSAAGVGTVFVTDTVAQSATPGTSIVSVASLLTAALRRLMAGESLAALRPS